MRYPGQSTYFKLLESQAGKRTKGRLSNYSYKLGTQIPLQQVFALTANANIINKQVVVCIGMIMFLPKRRLPAILQHLPVAWWDQ